MAQETIDYETGEIVTEAGNKNDSAIQEISSGPFMATPTGLKIRENGGIPYEVWEEYGRGLRRVESGLQWVIGDWLNYGEFKFKETYKKALEIWPQYSIDYLTELKWTSLHVNLLERSSNLSWVHHRRVAQFDVQTQRYWLNKAIINKWKIKDFQKAIREDRELNNVNESIAFSWPKQGVVINMMSGIEAVRAGVNVLSHADRDPTVAAYYLNMVRKSLAQVIRTIDLAIGEDDGA
jgi:hypothetical protein